VEDQGGAYHYRRPVLHDSPSDCSGWGEPTALSHHECWDAGCPSAIAGEALPLIGRICAVGDVFDALTSAPTGGRYPIPSCT